MKEIAPPATPKAKRHKLVIRGPEGEKESIYPVKMAEITFGFAEANRHIELEPLNPHICKGHLQWNIGPHDEIFMPETWPPEPLVARGFKVVPVDGDDPAAPEPPHLERAPRAVGCGDHHLEHPYANAPERRAEKRHVEVVILPEGALVCGHEGPCDTGTCEVYDPVAYDQSYQSLGTVVHAPRWIVRRPIWCPPVDLALHVHDDGGTLLHKLTPVVADDFLEFDLAPLDPSRSHQVTLQHRNRAIWPYVHSIKIEPFVRGGGHGAKSAGLLFQAQEAAT
jgi:hypothetical protein